jgi:hypothetical protein
MKKKQKLVGSTANKSLQKFNKTKAIAAFLILAFGISMIPATLLLDTIIQTEIDEAIAEQISVPDPDDDEYEDWLSNDNKDAVPFYSNFHMWNLTNPMEYIAGGIPVYEQWAHMYSENIQLNIT